jgi:hypothetical protein
MQIIDGSCIHTENNGYDGCLSKIARKNQDIIAKRPVRIARLIMILTIERFLPSPKIINAKLKIERSN